MTPCSFFAAGRCRNGRDCKFFHAARDDVAMIPPLCKFFLLGTCTDGGECKFLHTAPAQGSALRVNTKTGEKILEPGFYGISCKFFKYGNCCNGNNCPYLHSEEEGRLENKAEVATDGPRTLQSQIDKVEKKGSHTADMSGGGHGVDYNGEEEATELRDFITKEEELYYYGDPSDLKGAIAESKPSMTKESYGEAAKKDQKHEIMPFYEQRPTPPKMCNFFLKGKCRYEKSCFYSHSLFERVESEDEKLAIEEEIRLSQGLQCDICYENIIRKNERFGLLSGCNHSFCLTCLRNWRSSEIQPKQTVRQCPVCQTKTSFIIPSSRMVNNPGRKKALVEAYRKKLNGVSCRRFDEGRGACPFGTSCFYAHRYPDGTSAQVQTTVDADGQCNLLRQVRLDRFINQLEINE